MGQVVNLDAVEGVYSEVPEDRTELGLLIWYTVFDLPIDRPTLENAFVQAGLDEKFMPKPIQVQDVFRRMTSIRRKKLPVEDSGEVFANYYVAEISSTKDQIVRVLVKDIVDSGNVRLSHEDIGRFTLIRKDRELRFSQYGDIDETLETRIQDISDNFPVYCNYYNGKIVREIVRAVLYSMHTVSLKDHGGVYFVPRQHKELLYKLQKMVEILQEKNDDKLKHSSIRAITLMNKAQERIIIKETIEDHVQAKMGGINDFIGQVASVLRENGSIRKREVEDYLKQAKELSLTVRQYENLLEEDLNSIRAGVDVIRQQLSEMLNRVVED